MKKIKAVATRTSAIALLVLFALIGALFYFIDPAPDPREPVCIVDEIAVFTKTGWFCVVARRP